MHEFAKGLDLIICVEEKRDLLETHVRELLFNDREHAIVIGKKDEEGNTAVPGLRHARAQSDRHRASPSAS